MKKLNLKQKLAVFAILALVFIVLTLLAKGDSLTTDEKVHIPAGYLHIFKGNYLYNSEHPPLANDLTGLFVGIFAQPKAPENLPYSQWEYGDNFIYGLGQNADSIIFWGRFPIIIISILMLYVIFIWANQLWGFKGGMISLILSATCPNLLAHGHLATTDLILAFGYLLNFYFLWKFTKEYSCKNATYFGLALGLVLLTKFSALIVIPIDLLILAIYIIYDRKNTWPKIIKTVYAGILAIVLLWLVYIFSMWNDLRWLFFEHYGLNHFENLRSYLIGWIKFILYPFKKFKDGLDIVSEHNVDGHFSYLNGVFSQTGRWQYFPLAFLYKTPLSAIGLFVLSIYFYLKNQSPKLKEVSFFIILPAIIFFLFTVKGNINIGLRHALPVLPLIYIFIGSLALIKDKAYLAVVNILVLINIITAIIVYPQYLAYFNPVAGGTLGGKDHLSDSNLDWNQNVKRFSTYLKENKVENLYFECYDKYTIDYYGIKYQPIPKTEPVNGVVAMCAQQYLFSKITPDYAWFKNEKPTEVISGTIYLWDKTK